MSPHTSASEQAEAEPPTYHGVSDHTGQLCGLGIEAYDEEPNLMGQLAGWEPLCVPDDVWKDDHPETDLLPGQLVRQQGEK